MKFVRSKVFRRLRIREAVDQIRGYLEVHNTTDRGWKPIEEVILTADDLRGWAETDYFPGLPSRCKSRDAALVHIAKLKRAWGDGQLGITLNAWRRRYVIEDDAVKFRVFDLVKLGGEQGSVEIHVLVNRDSVTQNAVRVLDSLEREE